MALKPGALLLDLLCVVTVFPSIPRRHSLSRLNTDDQHLFSAELAFLHHDMRGTMSLRREHPIPTHGGFSAAHPQGNA